MDEMDKLQKRLYKCSNCGIVDHTRKKCRPPANAKEFNSSARYSFSGTTCGDRTKRDFIPGIMK